MMENYEVAKPEATSTSMWSSAVGNLTSYLPDLVDMKNTAEDEPTYPRKSTLARQTTMYGGRKKTLVMSTCEASTSGISSGYNSPGHSPLALSKNLDKTFQKARDFAETAAQLKSQSIKKVCANLEIESPDPRSKKMSQNVTHAKNFGEIAAQLREQKMARRLEKEQKKYEKKQTRSKSKKDRRAQLESDQETETEKKQEKRSTRVRKSQIDLDKEMVDKNQLLEISKTPSLSKKVDETIDTCKKVTVTRLKSLTKIIEPEKPRTLTVHTNPEGSAAKSQIAGEAKPTGTAVRDLNATTPITADSNL